MRLLKRIAAACAGDMDASASISGAPGTAKSTGRSKFRAKPTVVDGIRFASKGEARRYVELKTLIRAGHIRDLTLQPKFPLHVNGVLICTYVADFRYLRGGQEVIEDFKGMMTPVFRLKHKLMKAVYGITVEISR